MKIRFSGTLFFVLAYMATFTAWGQLNKPVNEENDRMILAYSFYLKQKMSLEFVSQRFPSLKDYVDNTLREWNREFISSIDNIDSALNASLGDGWKKTKDANYEKYTRVDYSGTTEDQARQFVDVVNDRTYGRIQSPIMETLLIWNPKYRKCPEKEFIDGYTAKFSTKEQKNPLPIHIKIVYPRSWKALEGNKKSNVVQSFISGYGLGSISFTVLADKAKNNYTPDKIKQLLTQESLQKAVAAQDKVLNYDGSITIDNCPAAVLSAYHEKDLADAKKIFTLTDYYVFYYKNYRILLKFAVLSDSADGTNVQFLKYQALEKKIINNIVILSQWGQ